MKRNREHRKLAPKRRFEDAEGEFLFRHLEVKVIINEKTQRYLFKPGPNKGYREADIEKQIDNVIEQLDVKYPMLDFKKVQVSKNAYNFIATGVRESALKIAQGEMPNATETETQTASDPGEGDAKTE